MKTFHALLFTITLATLFYAASGQAVSSLNRDCQSACPSTNSTCCGCCGTDSQCSGNQISKRCCPNGSGFCGCISSRGFCSGFVFNQTGSVTGTDTFGTCYDISQGTCSYDPTPNLWIVCPITHTTCKSRSFYTCCDSSSTCITSSVDSYPICQPKPTAPVSNCPSPLQSCGDACYDSFEYCCVNNGIVQKQFCGAAASSAAPSTVPTPVPTSNCPPTLSSCGDACYNSSEYCCFYNNLVQIQFCGTQQTTFAAPSTVPTPAPTSNCSPSLSSCGDACYDEKEYCCRQGNLVQSQFCTAAPVSTTDTPATSSSGINCGNLARCGDFCINPARQFCCNNNETGFYFVNGQPNPRATCQSDTSVCDGQCDGASCCPTPTGVQCFYSSSHVCSKDDNGESGVCPVGTNYCGGACYDATMYHCSGGSLVYGQA